MKVKGRRLASILKDVEPAMYIGTTIVKKQGELALRTKAVRCVLWYPRDNSVPMTERVCVYCGNGPDEHGG